VAPAPFRRHASHLKACCLAGNETPFAKFSESGDLKNDVAAHINPRTCEPGLLGVSVPKAVSSGLVARHNNIGPVLSLRVEMRLNRIVGA
jgi:hypothetical protein